MKAPTFFKIEFIVFCFWKMEKFFSCSHSDVQTEKLFRASNEQLIKFTKFHSWFSVSLGDILRTRRLSINPQTKKQEIQLHHNRWCSMQRRQNMMQQSIWFLFFSFLNQRLENYWLAFYVVRFFTPTSQCLYDSLLLFDSVYFDFSISLLVKNLKETFFIFIILWIHIAKLLNYSIAIGTDNIYTIFMLWQCCCKFI